jgi:hypothetical protein
MENPMTWTPVQRAIHEAISEHTKATAAGICGLSLESAIYHKLKEKGYLVEPPMTASASK